MAWQEILSALWLFLPAFVANMSPVFTAKVLPKWKTPIDFGAVHADGERMFGDGKTWRGLFLGGIAAGLTAAGQALWTWPLFEGLDFSYGLDDGASLWAIFVFGYLIGFWALAGDAVASYLKRRSGRKRGAPWFPVDQLDFVVASFLAILVFHPLLSGSWVLDHYFDVWVLGTIFLGTPALHLIVNRIGYWLRLKDVPW